MELSLPTKEQIIKIVRAAVYVGLSAAIDFLISQTTGTQFGVFTPVINIVLVSLKQLVTKA